MRQLRIIGCCLIASCCEELHGLRQLYLFHGKTARKVRSKPLIKDSAIYGELEVIDSSSCVLHFLIRLRDAIEKENRMVLSR